jgi:hypothetical protein
MSGVVGNLFGSKGARAESTTPTSYNTLPGFAQDAFKQGVTGIQGLATNSPNIFAPAGFNSTQQQAFDLAQQGFQPTDANSFGNYLSMFSNPFTNDVVNTTNQQIMQANAGLLNQIKGDANSVGAFGGTRLGSAQAEQNRNTLNTIAATDAGLNAGNFNNASANALSTINQNNTNRQQQLSNLTNTGLLQQNQATAQQQAPLTALQTLLAAAQGIPVGGGGTSLGAQADPGFLGRASQIAANFAQAAKAIGAAGAA